MLFPNKPEAIIVSKNTADKILSKPVDKATVERVRKQSEKFRKNNIRTYL